MNKLTSYQKEILLLFKMGAKVYQYRIDDLVLPNGHVVKLKGKALKVLSTNKLIYVEFFSNSFVYAYPGWRNDLTEMFKLYREYR